MPSASRPVLPDVSIRQLQYLLAVADEPTWAAAAESMGVSASALSQGLAELERRIGVPLFEPQGRRRLVRPAAAPVLEHARRVVALTGDLVDWAERVRGARSGRVRLGMIDVAAVVHFPDTVRAFRTEHADVSLTVTVAPSAVLFEQLRAGDLDLVVGVEPPRPVPGVSTAVLLEEPLVVVGPAGAGEWGPWVTFPAGSHTRELILDGLRRIGAPLTIAAESHQPDVLVQMVRLGLGWSVLPPGGLPDDVVVGEPIAVRRLVLARRDAGVSDPAVDELARRLDASARR